MFSYKLPFRYTIINTITILLALVFVISLYFIWNTLHALILFFCCSIPIFSLGYLCKYLQPEIKNGRINNSNIIASSQIMPAFFKEYKSFQMSSAGKFTMLTYIYTSSLILWGMIASTMLEELSFIGTFVVSLALSIKIIYNLTVNFL